MPVDIPPESPSGSDWTVHLNIVRTFMPANSTIITVVLEAASRDAVRRRFARWKRQDELNNADLGLLGLGLDRAPLRMELLVTAFRNGRLDALDFDHAAMLVIISWHLHQQAPDEALTDLLEALRKLEFDRTQAGGEVFSETRLTFWMLVVRRFLESEGSEGSWQMDAARVLRFYGTARRLPYRYYSAARWKSREARYAWMLPDLRAFPATGRL